MCSNFVCSEVGFFLYALFFMALILTYVPPSTTAETIGYMLADCCRSRVDIWDGLLVLHKIGCSGMLFGYHNHVMGHDLRRFDDVHMERGGLPLCPRGWSGQQREGRPLGT